MCNKAAHFGNLWKKTGCKNKSWSLIIDGFWDCGKPHFAIIIV